MLKNTVKIFNIKVIFSDVYEFHKKFSLPFACLIFTLVGAPLGMFSRRSGKGMGFGYGIIVVILYYFMLLLGQGWVSSRYLGPVFAAWMPDIFLGLIGFLLKGLALPESTNKLI